MIELRAPTHETVRELWQLEVAPAQQDFVAPNLVTLAQAPYEGGAECFGIWDGDTPVGFLALVDMRDANTFEDGDERQSAFLWRFMIAPEFQKRGFGRQALALCEAWVRDKGLPKLFTSAVQSNAVALALYEAVGFRRTGRIISGNEVELWKPVM